MQTTVKLITERENGGRRTGSGVVLSAPTHEQEHYILTTAHTFEPLMQQDITVVAPPNARVWDAQILAIDSERDLALLQAPIVRLPAAKFADGAYLVDPIWIIAFPWGRERTTIGGSVSQIDGAKETSGGSVPIWGPVQMVDASVSYGMSGGGVFDSRSGQLLGLVRGYRTAQLSLDSRSKPLQLPIAGETTVVSARTVFCFLQSIGRRDLAAANFSESEGIDTGKCQAH